MPTWGRMLHNTAQLRGVFRIGLVVDFAARVVDYAAVNRFALGWEYRG